MQLPPHHRKTIDNLAHPDRVKATTLNKEMPVMPPLKLLRFATVHERTGLSRSTIWRLEHRGQFPRHRPISANAVAWVESEVAAWIQAKVDVAV
jgi:prophage regulatory protein